MAYLALDRVSKQFGAQTVVDDFSLAVGKGEFVSFLGPSGCGKTTTLQMIAGFLDPSRGAIRLEGKDLAAVHPARRGLGIVFQSYALFPHMTAAENVAFGLEMRRVPRGERDERVRAALAMVGLTGYEDRYPRRMSGGQQQRVALARCLVYRPSLILMDESLSALDKKLRDSMRIEIKRLHREAGATIIFVTHDQEEALALADRICLMNDGQIEQLGKPEDIYERPANTFVADFIGASNLIYGTIAADGRIETVDGVLPLPDGCSAPVGEQAALVVRPEKLLLCKSDDGFLSGRVEESIYAGSETRLLVRLPSETLLTVRRGAGLPPVAIGENVFMRWDREQAGLLEGHSAAAIA